MANGGFYSRFMPHYKQACQEYPGLSIDEEKFLERLKCKVQDFHSHGGGEGINSSTGTVLSFDIMKYATVCIRKSNNQAAREILAYKHEIGSNHQVLRMVNTYFQLCRMTLDSLRRFQVCLRVTRDKLMALHGERAMETKVMEAIRCAEDGVDDFFLSLPDLVQKHVTMLIKLQQAREGTAENSTPRRVTTILLVTVFFGAVICSILVAAVKAPLVVAALPAAVVTITSWGPFVKWVDGLWAGNDEGLIAREAERVAVEKERNAVVQELEDIKLLLISSRVHITASNRETAVQCPLNSMADLDEQIEQCCSEVFTARQKFFQKLVEPDRKRDRARAFISSQLAPLELKIKDIFIEKKC